MVTAHNTERAQKLRERCGIGLMLGDPDSWIKRVIGQKGGSIEEFINRF